MADIVESNDSSSSSTRSTKVQTNIQSGSQIAIYPLYGGSYDSEDTLILPVSPSDVMFTEDSNSDVIKLINYGELPVSMNRKLATWSIDSFFPNRNVGLAYYSNSSRKGFTDNNRQFKYWFDISNDPGDPYSYYCDKLLNWKNNQTPLVFFFQTWDGYYNCQIKKFTYGRKDSVGNVYYQLEFQEYKEYTQF